MKSIYAALAACVLLSGCGIIKDEQGYPGGYAGRLADDYTITANSQRERVARMMIAVTVLAAVSADQVQNETDAANVSALVNSTMGTMAALLSAADRCDLGGEQTLVSPPAGTVVKPCSQNITSAISSPMSFETLAHDGQRALGKLVSEVSSNSGIGAAARGFGRNVSPRGLLELGKVLRRNIPAARRYFSTYRDASVIASNAAMLQCQVQSNRGDLGAGARAQCQDIAKVQQQLAGIKFTSFGEDIDGRTIGLIERTTRALARSQHSWKFQRQHYMALAFIVDEACTKLFLKQIGAEGFTKVSCAQGKSLPDGVVVTNSDFFTDFLAVVPPKSDLVVGGVVDPQVVNAGG